MKQSRLFFLRFALLVIVLSTFWQCKKESLPDPAPIRIPSAPEALPPATQEGRNTLGFLLDGKVWNARIEPVKPTYKRVRASYYHGGLSISAHRILGDSVDHQFVIYSKDEITRLGNFKLGLIPIDRTGIDLLGYNPEKKEYVSYGNDPGVLTITKLDTINHPGIISGTFKATLYNGPNETIEITEGRFDVKLP